ncbi:hypothetical protein GE21DRAFT_1019547 [Neurospora crassa]|nr:hypothetical protein GE21DRAFT_1019547 [Neurospora crassa]
MNRTPLPTQQLRASRCIDPGDTNTTMSAPADEVIPHSSMQHSSPPTKPHQTELRLCVLLLLLLPSPSPILQKASPLPLPSRSSISCPPGFIQQLKSRRSVGVVYFASYIYICRAIVGIVQTPFFGKPLDSVENRKRLDGRKPVCNTWMDGWTDGDGVR